VQRNILCKESYPKFLFRCIRNFQFLAFFGYLFFRVNEVTHDESSRSSTVAEGARRGDALIFSTFLDQFIAHPPEDNDTKKAIFFVRGNKPCGFCSAVWTTASDIAVTHSDERGTIMAVSRSYFKLHSFFKILGTNVHERAKDGGREEYLTWERPQNTFRDIRNLV